MIDDYRKKRGNWCVSSHRPYKLNILLHGTPGGGKTSFIKALQNKYNLHIVKINLQEVESEEKLMDLLCNPWMVRRNHKSHDSLEKIPLHQRLYIFEEIDCNGMADMIGKRRSHSDHDNNFDIESSEFDNNNDANSISDASILTPPQTSPLQLSIPISSKSNSITTMTMKTNKKKPPSNLKSRTKTRGDEKEYKNKNDSLFKKLNGGLDLGAMLNTFDGPQELNNFMAVFTTNHVENIDDAFIRPGRMDLIIELGHVTSDIARDIFEYHYCTLKNIISNNSQKLNNNNNNRYKNDGSEKKETKEKKEKEKIIIPLLSIENLITENRLLKELLMPENWPENVITPAKLENIIQEFSSDINGACIRIIKDWNIQIKI
jgi:SpoVK/Ycf46/Vps4 family AAA+-type ATPase